MTRLLGYFLAFLLALMTLDVLWGVVTRYAFGSQASWTEELARFLLIWIGLLGAAWASGQGMHLSIALLPNRLPPARRRPLELFIRGLILLFAVGVMVVGGLNLIYLTWVLGQTSAALRIPMSLVYAVVPLSGLLIAYYQFNPQTSR